MNSTTPAGPLPRVTWSARSRSAGTASATATEHAPGHEQKSPARFSDARQRGRRRRTDLAVLSDGAVVIDGERVDDHTVKSLPSRYHRAASGTRIRSHATIIELPTSSLFNRLPHGF